MTYKNIGGSVVLAAGTVLLIGFVGLSIWGCTNTYVPVDDQPDADASTDVVEDDVELEVEVTDDSAEPETVEADAETLEDVLADETSTEVEVGPVCGDSLIDIGEECDGDAPQPCTTSCGSTGLQSCSAECAWGVCTPPAEVTCNFVDDDCDGETDEGCPWPHTWDYDEYETDPPDFFDIEPWVLIEMCDDSPTTGDMIVDTGLTDGSHSGFAVLRTFVRYAVARCGAALAEWPHRSFRVTFDAKVETSWLDPYYPIILLSPSYNLLVGGRDGDWHTYRVDYTMYHPRGDCRVRAEIFVDGVSSGYPGWVGDNVEVPYPDPCPESVWNNIAVPTLMTRDAGHIDVDYVTIELLPET